jgi:hypothetical protein
MSYYYYYYDYCYYQFFGVVQMMIIDFFLNLCFGYRQYMEILVC